MSLDLATMKRRSHIMLAVSLLAGVCAMAGIVGYFRFHQSWSLGAIVASALLGFGAQIWFIAGLRGPGKGA